MEYKDIKPGMQFHFEVRVLKSTQNDRVSMKVESLTKGWKGFLETPFILEALNKQTLNKQSFSNPRFFHKGDIVRYVPTGRSMIDSRYCGLKDLVVTKDETNMVVRVSNEKNGETYLDFFELELIKSIEEIKTAKLCTIEENSDAWIVKRNGLEMASFIRFTEGEESDKAKRFAEDYCAELNKGN